jgi:hypothetical protein
MAKIKLVEFHEEQGFSLAVKRTIGRAELRGENLNAIVISFPHGREERCHVSRCLHYPDLGPAFFAASHKQASRTLRGVPAAKPWRPCKFARQNGK